MSVTLHGWKTWLVIAVAAVVGFLTWLLVLFAVWLLARGLGSSVSFWTMTEALSAGVAIAALITGGVIAYRELNELANSRYMEVADRLFSELNSPESIEARRWIFLELPDDPEEGIASLTPEGQAYVKRTLNSLDRVAFLTQGGWIPEELVMPWMNPMIVKSWIKLKPYVDHESRRRNEPDYYKSARTLSERCLAWRKENLLDARVTWIKDAL